MSPYHTSCTNNVIPHVKQLSYVRPLPPLRWIQAKLSWNPRFVVVISRSVILERENERTNGHGRFGWPDVQHIMAKAS